MLHKTLFFSIFRIILVFQTIKTGLVYGAEFESFPKNIRQHLLSNNVYVLSEVDTQKGMQSLNFIAAGLHQQTCKKAMKTIGYYERYQNHIGFVRKSEYRQGRINLNLSSTFIPFDMILNFKIPRISGIGRYEFIFDNGFLLNLKGEVLVKKYEKDKKYKCYIAMRAKWEGKKTKIPDYVFEVFTKTIGEIGLKKLFRISGHRF